jgi:hypothetical protein
MMFSIIVLLSAFILLSVPHVTGYANNGLVSRNLIAKKPTILQASSDDAPLNDRTREKLDKLVNSNKVLLFMKGNKLFPQW